MRPGDTWKVTFALSGTATGTPTAKLLHNGVNDSAVTPTVAAGAETNMFTISSVIPSTGYAASDTIEYDVSATVSGVSAKNIVARTYINAPVTVAANGITLASFAADTQSDGTAQAGSTTSTINFDAADDLVNSITGAFNRYVSIVGGTGIGQIMPVASIAGSSGSKVGTLATGYAWATAPDATSTYAIGSAYQATIASSLTAAQVRAEMDANSTRLAQVSGAFVGSSSVLSAAALANAPGGSIVLATGVVVGTPSSTAISISGANLLGTSGDYNGRRLYFNAGTKATYLTDPCATHTVVGSGNSAVHTFAFTAAQRLVVAGDVAAIVGD